MTFSRFVALLCVWVLVSGFGSGARLLAPDADLWARWTAHNPDSAQSLSHAAWQDFLDRYRQEGQGGQVARVDYGGVDAQGRQILSDYLSDLSAVVPAQLNRAEQFAYWVNLYNALTVDLVLDAWPVESIKDIDLSPGFFASGPWDADLISVAGEKLTLNDIEHRILRPIWRDARVHYVINCASRLSRPARSCLTGRDDRKHSTPSGEKLHQFRTRRDNQRGKNHGIQYL